MRIDHVGVLVGDLEAAKAFARDVLGLGEPAREFQEPKLDVTGAFYELGDAQLELFTRAGGAEEELPAGAPAALDHIAVEVDDIDAERERLDAHGVRFTGPGGPGHVGAPIEVRGSLHLWTDPATSGGYRLQLIQRGA